MQSIFRHLGILRSVAWPLGVVVIALVMIGVLCITPGGVTDAARRLLTGADIADDSLTGADIDESSLGTVPNAANADKLGGVDANRYVRDTKFADITIGPLNSVNPMQSATVNAFTFRFRCESSGGMTVATIAVEPPTTPLSGLGFAYATRTASGDTGGFAVGSTTLLAAVGQAQATGFVFEPFDRHHVTFHFWTTPRFSGEDSCMFGGAVSSQ